MVVRALRRRAHRTIYSDGGGFQWGGRFLSPLLGPLAALAAVAVAERTPGGSPRAWPSHLRWFAGGLTALLAVQAVACVVLPDRMRENARKQLASVIALGEPVNIAGGQMIPRLDWRAWPDRCWISVPVTKTVADARGVLTVLKESGVSEAAYAGLDPDLLEDAGFVVRPDAGNRAIGVVEVPGADGPLEISPPYRCDTDGDA